MIDDDGVRGQEEVGEALGDLGELQPRAVKDLRRETTQIHRLTRSTTSGLRDASTTLTSAAEV